MWLTLWACRPPEPGHRVVDSETGTGSHATYVPPPQPPDSGASTPTGDTGGVGFDCASVPDTVGEPQVVTGAVGFHDLAFTADGRIVGANPLGDLMAADASGAVALYAPLDAVANQMAWLPDGDLAVATDQGIARVAASGAVTPIPSDVRPYGLTLGPGGKLYASDGVRTVRIDPTTGATQGVIGRETLPMGGPRVVAFSPDDSRMYVGTMGSNVGEVYVFDLDADGMPIGSASVFASGVGLGALHDAMGVDVCGNVYVIDLATETLFRISPAGRVVTLLHTEHAEYPHGLEWGGPGWRADALYLPRPYADNSVIELVVGVPARAP